MLEQIGIDGEAQSFAHVKPFRLSPLRDLYVPLVIAVIPAGLFALLGFVTKGLDRPGAEPSVWVIVVMVVLQTLGIIAMAVVILAGYEFGFRELSMRTNGRPPIWRRLILFCSLAFVLLFDALTNVAAAFDGAGPLLFLAVPAFIAYVLSVRAAFARL